MKVREALAPGLLARAINFGLGVWLMASEMIWPHAGVDRVFNAFFVGVLILAFSLMSLVEPVVRLAIAGLAVFVGLSAVTFPHHPGEVGPWPNVVLAAVMFLVALVPNPRVPLRRRPPPTRLAG
jgi:peptidoglycan/LPS O-acetylase OafA/YrhL